jgi:hypothetical protein
VKHTAAVFLSHEVEWQMMLQQIAQQVKTRETHLAEYEDKSIV